MSLNSVPLELSDLSELLEFHPNQKQFWMFPQSPLLERISIENQLFLQTGFAGTFVCPPPRNRCCCCCCCCWWWWWCERMTPFTYTMTTMSFRCSMLAGNPVQTRLQVFDLFLAARATGRRTNREEYQLEPCHYSWLKCLRKRKRGTPGERGGGRGDYSQSQVSTFAFFIHECSTRSESSYGSGALRGIQGRTFSL